MLDPDQRDLLGNVEGLQMTVSGRINSRTDLNRIDETRGNITVEERDLLVNEKYVDRQTRTHYNCNNHFRFRVGFCRSSSFSIVWEKERKENKSY